MWEKRACDGGGGEDGEVCRVMVVCDDGMCDGWLQGKGGANGWGTEKVVIYHEREREVWGGVQERKLETFWFFLPHCGLTCATRKQLRYLIDGCPVMFGQGHCTFFL